MLKVHHRGCGSFVIRSRHASFQKANLPSSRGHPRPGFLRDKGPLNLVSCPDKRVFPSFRDASRIPLALRQKKLGE